MNKIKLLLTKYLNERDEWLYLTLIISVSLYQLNDPLWLQYFSHIISNSAYLTPLVLCKVFQHKLKALLEDKSYKFLRFVCFILYPVILIVIFYGNNTFAASNLWSDILSLNLPAGIIFYGMGLEGLLLLNHYVSGKRLINWAPKNIGLGELVLLFMAGISIYAALLISSDLPLWFSSNSIQTTLHFSEIANHPLLTVSLAFQLFCLFFLGYIFYWINHHVLVKSILAERGPLIYLCAVITCVVLLYPIFIELYLLLPINSMAEPIIPAVNADAFDWHNGRVFLAVMLLSLPIILVIQWHKKSSQFALLEKESIQTELRLLKQQIDPHFFFNTLNNLYALCRKKSEQAPEVVLQLAELMQYVVYRGQERSVLIDEDISYINDYINLQSIRLSNKITIKIEVDVDDPQTVISPLLLIILVENAFKHGVELATKDCYLHLHVTVKDKQLIFICENSLEESTMVQDDQVDVTEGVGLANLKRRLALIYPNNYQLILTQQATKFTAQLNINLAKVLFLNDSVIKNSVGNND
jgi:hypothetical protein